jgi:FkbH-like protein
MASRVTARKDWYNLSWLPELSTGEFSTLCSRIRADPANTLRMISSFKMTEVQLTKLSAICSNLPGPLPEFDKCKLTILSDANCSFLVQALKSSALRYGIWLEVRVEAMGNILAKVLDPTSDLYANPADAVLFAPTYHRFSRDSLGDEQESERVVQDFISEIHTVRDLVRERLEAGLIIQTIPQDPESFLGNFEVRTAGTVNSLLDSVNREIRSSDLEVIDIERFANLIGLSTWHDLSFWHWAKVPFAPKLIPIYADYVARFLGILRGRGRKCLVLDLDNTLWGGVIGDDGLDGISLGQGSPVGEAHLAVQKMAFDLRRRGIILAVCSKNDEAIARLPFKNHREMLLREEHIAVFQANWSDKASNLEEIATTLTLSLDALVLLDDNPSERAIVRRELPLVAVPEIPCDEPAQWPLILAAAGYFDTAKFVKDDLRRAEQYSENAKRSNLMIRSRDLHSYLTELEMEMEITSFIDSQRPRITQLINRSNQFNLTTPRYTVEEVTAMERNPTFSCFAARLKDKFGDNGIVSVVICRAIENQWHIDTWLMSCRVLGRHVENALLNHLVNQATEAGKTHLLGHYIPTTKNALVEKHFEKLGFAELERSENGLATWTLDLKAYTPSAVPILISKVVNRPGDSIP